MQRWHGAGFILKDTKKGTAAYKIESGANGGYLDIFDGSEKANALQAILPDLNELVDTPVASTLLFIFLGQLLKKVTKLNDCHKKEVRKMVAVYTAIRFSFKALRFVKRSPVGLAISFGVMGMMFPSTAFAAQNIDECVNPY